jgi:hypothetical protein
MLRNPRDRQAITAVHEAGHAVAAWKLGQFFYSVQIATDGLVVDRRGRSIPCDGLTEITGAYDPQMRKLTTQLIPIGPADIAHATLSATIDAAGPVAEARHAKRGLAQILLGPGREDLGSIVGAGNFVNVPSLCERSVNLARKLFARPGAWGAVAAIADALLRQRCLDFEQVSGICTAWTRPATEDFGPLAWADDSLMRGAA